MSDTSPAVAPFGPVKSRERIVILDIRRGLALLRVAVANVWLWFSGAWFLFPDRTTHYGAGLP